MRSCQHEGPGIDRDPQLTPGQFQAFAQAIGTPVEYPFASGIPGFPVIIEVKKLAHEKVNFGGVWHSDTAYLEQPPMATLLLDGLVALNTSAKAEVSRTREDRLAVINDVIRSSRP